MKSPDFRLLVILVFPLAPSSSGNAADVDCLDTEAALTYWRPVREQATTAKQPADRLALELVSCLGSPNPELRDRIGYELFTYWLRQEKISDETRAQLLAELSERLADRSEGAAFSRSFSALILSEVMRSDAITPFMSDAERQNLIGVTISSLDREDDFRGLEADVGWVHPVAHMADLLWRFTLHPSTSARQAESILDGIRSKIAPTGVSYAFNEGDRLARIVATIIQKNLVDTATVSEWLTEFQAPRSMEKWSEAFQKPEGMAELHNTKQFLRALADQLDGTEVNREIAGPLNELIQGFTQLI